MDNLGSARTIVKIKGTTQTVKTLDYKPFGDTYDDANPERIGYEGKEKDEESSLFDYGVRQYDPALGRFLAVDPLVSKYTAINPYQYAFNNPLSFKDISGYEPKPEKKVKDRVQVYVHFIEDAEKYEELGKLITGYMNDAEQEIKSGISFINELGQFITVDPMNGEVLNLERIGPTLNWNSGGGRNGKNDSQNGIILEWYENIKDADGNTISVEKRAKYYDGKLYVEICIDEDTDKWELNGAEYTGDNKFVLTTLGFLNDMKNSGDNRLTSRLNALENADMPIYIDDYTSIGGDESNTTRPLNEENFKSGIKTGSRINYKYLNVLGNPSSAYTNAQVILAHELLGHAWLNLLGISHYGYNKMVGKTTFTEIWSINIGNVMAGHLGLKPRLGDMDDGDILSHYFYWKK